MNWKKKYLTTESHVMEQKRIPKKKWFINYMEYMENIMRDAEYGTPTNYEMRNVLNINEDLKYYMTGFTHYKMKDRANKLQMRINKFGRKYTL